MFYPRLLVVILSACLLMAAGAGRIPTARSAELRGTASDRLKADVQYLASDELEGRGVGTAGLNLAADHIRDAFQAAGLDVTAVDGGAFQKFTMVTGSELREPNTLKFSGPEDKVVELKLESDFNVCSFGGSGTFDGGIVFGGYGISAKDVPYHDLEGIDVKGKIVLVMRRNPQQDNPKSPFAVAHGISRHADLKSKISVCSSAGAAAVVFVNDPYSIESELEKSLDAANSAVIKAARELAKLEPADAAYADARAALTKAFTRIDDVAQQAHSGGYDELMKFGYAGAGRDGAIPVFHMSVARCDELLKAAIGKSLDDLQATIDATLKPQSQVLEGWTATGQASLEQIRTEVKNVIGVLEGEGPLAEETIVVGAHYDHVGRGGSGSLAPGSMEIHNGADDNASGTAALIEVARRLTARGEKLPRRLVFIAFTAEELGLIGSAKYVDQPLVPLDRTIAMFNMDMVGRLVEERLTVFGVGTSPTFEADLRRFAEPREFKLALKPEGFGPSDQSSFYAKKIPVLHFFTGTHSDYHRPGDDWEKINLEGMDRIVGLVQDIVLHTATTQQRPEYVEVAGNAEIARSGNRPYFGSIPDFGREGDGYALSGVSPGSPAAEAGLLAGDSIVQLGDRKVSDLNDFDLALRDYSAGDEIDVTIRRGAERLILKVTLGRPR